jgi:DNA replication licensing factor MCM6
MNRDEAVEPEISTELLQRYIRLARTFKPVFTEEAKVVLVEKYKELRANDAQGGIGRSSYRITVRQLESLIRLSEAVARANCVEEILPRFVREAYNLLRQSIVTVEKDDIEVDEDEENEQPAQADADDMMDEVRDRDGDSPMAEDGEAPAEAQQEQQPARPRTTKITYEKYTKTLNLLVRRVMEDEAASGNGVEQEELLTWYLEQIESELESNEDLQRERGLAKKVLKRMVKVCPPILQLPLSSINTKTNSSYRITSSCPSAAKASWTKPKTSKLKTPRSHNSSTCSIPTAQSRI